MHPVTAPDSQRRTSASLRTVILIPARYHSTRLPGKALADIAGRPMIEHVYRRAMAVRGVNGVVVATDDERIRQAVHAFGGTARLTRPDHRTGTDRIAEVARELDCEIVINLQGDEPLIQAAMIEQVMEPFRDAAVVMTTLRRAIEEPREAADPNVVKVVVDRNGDALYFSRSSIPFVRDPQVGTVLFKHIGLYGYRREFLITFAALPPTPLETAESLEQLRAIEHGYRIRTPETSFDSIGVDTPEDLERVRRQLDELAAGTRA
ncbi:MAG TPA: 3-deoxy-manno-octulosonate cytidylyltransferase [Vicinamibacterales bacterium]|nr:3-deoxy-manno-octulosonate cytidylyltransferase [Vicinamibacterales bacterium]